MVIWAATLGMGSDEEQTYTYLQINSKKTKTKPPPTTTKNTHHLHFRTVSYEKKKKACFEAMGSLPLYSGNYRLPFC